MRILAKQCVWAALLLPILAGTVGAAPAPPADEKAEAGARLDAVLQQWAKASDAVQEAHFTIRVTDHDSTTGDDHKSTREVFFKKPDLMRIDYRKADGSLESSLVCVKKTVHYLSVQGKSDRYCTFPDGFRFPEQPGRYPDEGGLGVFVASLLEFQSWFAIGPPVRDLKARYGLSLTKEDDHWICLELKPRTTQDRVEFKRMEVVLNRKSFRLRRLWIEQPNDEEWTYDFGPPRGGSEEAVTADSIMKGLPEDYQKVDCNNIFEDPNKAVIEQLKKQEDQPAGP